jgi:CheY-like chemotaxis protein
MAAILIIDDDAALRALIREVLERAGYSVFETGDGRTALALVEEVTVDLVLTDLVMPERDGLEVIMTLRSRFPSLPVIAMSGGLANTPLYLDIAKKLGARALLTKPFPPDQLLTAISEARNSA